MVLVHSKLLEEAAKMLQYTNGGANRQPRMLAHWLEEASRGVQVEWPPKNYSPLP